MDSYLYLIRNGDLYNIGSGSNIDKVQEVLKPGELFAYLKTKEAAAMRKNLHDRYSDVRLPSSDYFKLSRSQLLECQLMMKRKGGSEYFQPIFKGKTKIVTFIFAWLLISSILIKLGFEPILDRLF